MKNEKAEATFESEIKEKINIDDLMERVGAFGYYQIRTQSVFFLFMLPLTYQVLIMYFAAADPPWRCKDENINCRYKGLILPNMGKMFHHRCEMNRSDWEYATSKKLSIITEVST